MVFGIHFFRVGIGVVRNKSKEIAIKKHKKFPLSSDFGILEFQRGEREREFHFLQYNATVYLKGEQNRRPRRERERELVPQRETSIREEEEEEKDVNIMLLL